MDYTKSTLAVGAPAGSPSPISVFVTGAPGVLALWLLILYSDPIILSCPGNNLNKDIQMMALGKFLAPLVFSPGSLELALKKCDVPISNLTDKPARRQREISAKCARNVREKEVYGIL
jgi:hypothetical protein